MGTRTVLIGLVALLAYNEARQFSVHTDHDLSHALSSVRPGDTIHLLKDQTYHFESELSRNGHPHAPITLTGESGTKIAGEGGAIVLRGSNWRIQNLKLENVREGIIVKGSNNTLKSLHFHDIEEEGVVLNGNKNVVKNCVFNGANHGIVVFGRDSQLLKNSITSITTSVTLAPRSCCGVLEDNTFNGLVDVVGSDYKLTRNTANSDVAVAGKRNNLRKNVINGKLDVSGCGNYFFGNTAGSSGFSGTCYNWDDGKNNFGINNDD